MKRVFRVTTPGKMKDSGLRGLGERLDVESLDVKVALIQALIPVGLQAVQELLEEEVVRLAGERHQRIGRQPGCVRWGPQKGSIYLADQKLPLTPTRVRDRQRNHEVPLQSDHALQTPRAADAGLFRKVLLGLSCRDDAAAAEAVPAAFGLSASTVSRRFIQASATQRQALQARDLRAYDVVARVRDGQTVAQDSMVIALGVTLTGDKVVLGFDQTATENETVCRAFLRELVEHGLRVEPGLLVVRDGAKGLRAAVTRVFGAQTPVQCCQWHKRENVVAYLPKTLQDPWRRKLQAAIQRPTYAEAQAALSRRRPELRLLNASAVTSLEEGLEETLTLHRLGVFRELGIRLKTTNCLESLNSLVAPRVAKVDHWRSSDQKQRWLAAALLDIEPRLRRLNGFRALPLLRVALERARQQEEGTALAVQVA